MGKFEKALRGHDWYYAYSDDQGVWRRGEASVQDLLAQSDSLHCPYNLNELRMFVHDMVLEDFEEREPGKFYRKGKANSCVASTHIYELISRAKSDDIRFWFNSNDSE